MRWEIHGRSLELVEGDITEQQVDAIVNAANSALMGGSGVDGAIHQQGGPAIMEETDRRYPNGCPCGSAVISGAGELPARYVIHAVGPVWFGGEDGEPHLLAAAHQRSLELAAEHDCSSIAFPALSTGAFGYPMDQAAQIALRTAAAFLQRDTSLRVVRFVLFGGRAEGVFQEVAERLLGPPGQES